MSSSVPQSALELNQQYAEHLRENLIDFLTGQYQPSPEADNQPQQIIRASIGNLGHLSRLLDAFTSLPCLDQSVAKEMSQEEWYEHFNSLLEAAAPILLNEERTALHPRIIEALGKSYDDLIEFESTEERTQMEQNASQRLARRERAASPEQSQKKEQRAQAIANYVMKAVVFSDGGRILETLPDVPKGFDAPDSPYSPEEKAHFESIREQKVEASTSYLKIISELSKQADVNGLFHKQTLYPGPLGEAIDALFGELDNLSDERIRQQINDNLQTANVALGRDENAIEEMPIMMELAAQRVFDAVKLYLASAASNPQDDASPQASRITEIVRRLIEQSRIEEVSSKHSSLLRSLTKSQPSYEDYRASDKEVELTIGPLVPDEAEEAIKDSPLTEEEIRQRIQRVIKKESSKDLNQYLTSIARSLETLHSELSESGSEAETSSEISHSLEKIDASIARALNTIKLLVDDLKITIDYYQLEGEIEGLDNLDEISSEPLDLENLEQALSILTNFMHTNAQTLKKELGITDMSRWLLFDRTTSLQRDSLTASSSGSQTLSSGFAQTDEESTLSSQEDQIERLSGEIASYQFLTYKGATLTTLEELENEVLNEGTKRLVTLNLLENHGEGSEEARVKLEKNLEDIDKRSMALNKAHNELSALHAEREELIKGLDSASKSDSSQSSHYTLLISKLGAPTSKGTVTPEHDSLDSKEEHRVEEKVQTKEAYLAQVESEEEATNSIAGPKTSP